MAASSGRQWLEWVLALPSDPQRRSARHEHSQPVRGGEQRREVGRSREQMLEVVHQQEQLFPAQVAEEVVTGRQGPSDLREHELGIGKTGEGNPEHSVRERADQLRRRLESEAGLARSPGARDRHQPRPLDEQSNELLQLLLPAQERGPSQWKIRRIERPKRRELVVSELVEAFGRGQILQAMHSQITQIGAPSSRSCVVCEITTCPPWAAAAIRAARWTSIPT